MAKKQAKPEIQEMSNEEARAFRASLVVDKVKVLNQKQKREAFKIYWTENKKKFGMTSKLEEILWLHLVSTKNDSPENFAAGLQNFGIKKV